MVMGEEGDLVGKEKISILCYMHSFSSEKGTIQNDISM
jgi:hypothetical protein